MTKEQAILELQNYIDITECTNNETRITMLINMGIADINSAEDSDRIVWFLSSYKATLDAIQTDVEIEQYYLENEKREVKITLNSFNNIAHYGATEQMELTQIIADYNMLIDNANNDTEVYLALYEAVDLILATPRLEFKDTSMLLNTSTYDFDDIAKGKDPDLFKDESNTRLIQLYFNKFPNCNLYPGTSKPKPSLKLMPMIKEVVE